jgi:hypothetical protein
MEVSHCQGRVKQEGAGGEGTPRWLQMGEGRLRRGEQRGEGEVLEEITL